MLIILIEIDYFYLVINYNFLKLINSFLRIVFCSKVEYIDLIQWRILLIPCLVPFWMLTWNRVRFFFCSDRINV